MSWILKHWVSEICDSMSNRKQKTLTSPTEHIYFTHQNRQNENHSVIQNNTRLHPGTWNSLCTVTDSWMDKRSGKKDLIIKSKNIWYITGGMDPGPAPAEKRDHLYHIKKWENDLYKGSVQSYKPSLQNNLLSHRSFKPLKTQPSRVHEFQYAFNKLKIKIPLFH